MVSDRLSKLARIGRDRLVTGPMDALRHVVNPSAIVKQAPELGSRQTVYETFARQRPPAEPGPLGSPPWEVYDQWHAGDRAAAGDASVLAAVVEAMDLGWGAPPDEGVIGLVAGEALPDPRARFVDALRDHVRHQFTLPGVAVGWLAHAAALPASPRWREDADTPMSDADRELGLAILAARRSQYDAIEHVLTPLLEHAMHELGREVSGPGVEAQTLMALMQALMEGAVLRMAADPEALSPELVAEAMVRLGESFSRRGSWRDPSRPMDDAVAERFNEILTVARRSWGADGEVAFPSLALPGVDPEEVADLFVDASALGQSILWREVGRVEQGAGLGRAGRAMLVGRALQRLIDAADDLPDVVRAVLGVDPAPGTYADELVTSMETAIRSLAPACDAASTARSLVRAACDGQRGRAVIDALDTAIPLGLPPTSSGRWEPAEGSVS